MIDIHATSAPAFVVAVEGDEFRIADVNAPCLARSGMAIGEQLGKSPLEFFPPALAQALIGHYTRCATARTSVFYETEYVLAAGYTVWTTTLVPILDRAGRVTTLVGICTDVTEERLNERVEKSFQEKMSLAMGTIEGGFWVYDMVSHEFEMSKPLAELIAGPGHDTLSLAEYAGYIHADDLCAYGMNVEDADSDAVEYRVISHDGQTRWMQSKRRFYRDGSGAVVRAVGLVLDVTAQKKTMLALEGEAHTDALTCLKNRRAFDKIAGRSFRASVDRGSGLALVLLDLDRFKPINDIYGHRLGDELLRKVGKRLSRLVRPDDTLARIGGDEFAVLLHRSTDKAAERLVERIGRAFAKPFVLDGKQVFLGASCGAAVQGAADSGVADLIDRADRALYEVKREGRRLTA